MAKFRELKPPSRLEACVECIWISKTNHPTTHRVLPDGCADIIYTRTSAQSTLHFVGPMTHHRDIAVTPGTTSVGVRFRPAMWTGIVRLRGAEVIDKTISLDDLALARLARCLDSAEDTAAQAAILANAIPAPEGVSEIQKAVQFLERNSGQISAAKLSQLAGISQRQFRRQCLEQTSLAPKLLSRILRFRKAQALLSAHERATDVAAACGYFDQSHMIADYKEFSGRTPTWAPTAHPLKGHRAPAPEYRSGEDRHPAAPHDEPCD